MTSSDHGPPLVFPALTGPEAAARRPSLPLSEPHRLFYGTFPSTLMAAWGRTDGSPLVRLWGFEGYDRILQAFARDEARNPDVVRTDYDGPMSTGTLPLFAEDEMLIRFGGEAGPVVVSDAPSLYEWATQGRWFDDATIVRPAKTVQMPAGYREPVRWPKTLRPIKVRRAMAHVPRLGDALMLALPDEEWGSPAGLAEVLREVPPTDHLYAARVVLPACQVDVSNTNRPIMPGNRQPMRGIDEISHLLCAQAARLVLQAQADTARLMHPWLEAWAEAVPYAPGLMLGHFAQWLVFRLLGDRASGVPSFGSERTRLAQEMHDIGIPPAAAKGLVCPLDGLRPVDLQGPFETRAGPFRIHGGRGFDLTLTYAVKEGSHMVASFPVRWKHVGVALLHLAAQRRIVIV